MAEGFYDTGQANPVFRICRSKVPCGPQADANAGRDHCEPLRRRDATLTLEALLAGGRPAPVELLRPPTANVPVPQPRRFYSSGAATPKTPWGTVTRTVSPVGVRTVITEPGPADAGTPVSYTHLTLPTKA